SGDLLNDVLQHQHFVGLLDQGAAAYADLTLACRGYFVVVHFHHEAHCLECVAHLGANVLEVVDGRNGEVTALDAGTVTGVRPAHVVAARPSCRSGLNGVTCTAHAHRPGHAVENEELVFGTEGCVVGDAGAG